MTLSSAGAIANQSLGAISTEINVVSRNIGGANASGYNRKLALLSMAIDGAPEVSGIRRATNLALFQNLLRTNAAQSQSSVISDALTHIDQILNVSAGTASDLSNSHSPAVLISVLANALQSCSVTPSDMAASEAALIAAQSLASGLHEATAATQQVRQQSDSEIAACVAEINSLLTQFQQVNHDVVAGAATGADITDYLDKRDGILSELSKRIGVSTIVRANYDMAIYTDGGATLFQTAPRTVSFTPTSAFSAATVGNQVSVDGTPITGAAAIMPVRSGKLAGLIELRDNVATKFQDQLDEIARGLITAFGEYDQTNPSLPSSPGLFTFAGATTVPGVRLTVGLAGDIRVNANVDPNQGGDLTRLRDGGIVHPGNPAYIYNTTGASGYAARLLQLNADISVPQPFDPSVGLGAQSSVLEYATNSIGWLSEQEKQFSSTANYQSTLLAQATTALSNATGVNLDEQMSRMLDLENSYQASAKLLATIDAMYQALFQSIRA